MRRQIAPAGLGTRRGPRDVTAVVRAARSEFHAPGSEPPPRVLTRTPDVVTALVLHPGTANVLHVTVEARRREGADTAVADGVAPPTRSLFATKGNARTALGSDAVLLDVGNGTSLHLGDVGSRARPSFITLLSDSRFVVGFVGCNVAHVEVY